MRSLALAICIVTCAQADTFAERWPTVEAVEAVARQPAGAQRAVRVHGPSRTTKHKVSKPRIACHRQYYTVNKWRYWRCKR